MINEKILFLTLTNCGIPELEKAGLGTGINNINTALGKPLEKVFSRVIYYDVRTRYAQSGPGLVNEEIISIVRSESPRYVLWPTSMYEIQEKTLQSIRKTGTQVVGVFFDDEIRFESYSRWWIPYLDHIITADAQSVSRYKDLDASVYSMLITANEDVFRKMEEPQVLDVSFVGSKIADREELVDKLLGSGIRVETFGTGWKSGHVSLEEIIRIYNTSRINLCFVKSYQPGHRPQLKDKVFQVCMSGGFLLCEYMPEIEKYFEVDKEVVCFKSIDEAIEKIIYYLDNEEKRQAIADAGWERAQREHSQANLLETLFLKLEEMGVPEDRLKRGQPHYHDLPDPVRNLAASYHLDWAKGLMLAGFEPLRWKEELDLAALYDPDNRLIRLFSTVGHLPHPIRKLLIKKISLPKMLRTYLSYGIMSPDN